MVIAGLQKQSSNPQSRCWFVHKGTLKTPYGQVNNVKNAFFLRDNQQMAFQLQSISTACSSPILLYHIVQQK